MKRGRGAVARREALLLAGGTMFAVVAGCTDDDGGTGDGATAASSTSTTAPLGTGGVPEPTDYLLSNWRTDPYALGSYSYLAVGSTPQDRNLIAQPVDGRLFFAGEALHADHPATVHGAHLSGIEAAETMIDAGVARAVIVGAGMAGLTAAQALRDEGVSVVLLEARDRIGGRVHTDHSLGAALDVGASWIHGEDGNPLTALADEAGIERIPTDFESMVVRNSSGEEIDLGDAPPEFLAVLGIEMDYAADVDQLAPGYAEEGAEFGGDDVGFPQGYSQVIEHVAGGLDVATNEVVERIALTGGEVAVTSTSGVTTADAALVTVPLGVLKAGSIGFDPPLPDSKLGAIDRLGMGHLSKVYLRFPEVFWDEGVELFGYLGNDPREFPLWVNMAFYTGEPVLMAFQAGSRADEASRWSEEQTVAAAMAAIRNMTGET
ncbi:MAG: NAD(P)-binding protein [Actinomycetia bacterium]|nr:NAD(P)-binding protein [Actinomycetes bacterium]